MSDLSDDELNEIERMVEDEERTKFDRMTDEEREAHLQKSIARLNQAQSMCDLFSGWAIETGQSVEHLTMGELLQAIRARYAPGLDPAEDRSEIAALCQPQANRLMAMGRAQREPASRA